MFTSIVCRKKQFVNPDWFENYMEESNRKYFAKKLEESKKCEKCKKETCCKKKILEIEDLFPSSSNHRDDDIKINTFKFMKRNRKFFLLSMIPCGLFLLSRLSSNK